jgi:hypothetical protein
MVLQGPGDAAAQVWSGRLASSAAGSGANQRLTGYLDQILPLNQKEEAAGYSRGNGISQRQVLQHQGITGTEGRAGKRGSHLGTAEDPTPNGQPQGCDKDAPTGRMARSLTQREDWTRDLGGCLTAWWQAITAPAYTKRRQAKRCIEAVQEATALASQRSWLETRQ